MRAWANNAVSSCVAILRHRAGRICWGRNKCPSVEPLTNTGIRKRNRLARQVWPQGSVGAALDIRRIAKNPGRERKPRSNRPIAAPLPITENCSPCRRIAKPAAFVSKRQFEEKVAGESVCLVEAAEPTLPCQLKWILCNLCRPCVGRA